ncbi:hypothetical protein K3722_00405 [Leisingera caerulea]|uniref:Peptidase M48 domain-containing protein n=1 Tax=Leisingera caerulea TaxID=506591 RepID=A0ABY5WX72_LEICA|nr:hypothetical protein [Leisingera caerulea]UWQ58630.1 hypothetical protein K3722_00405 [Leisingera caerulea]
MTNTEESWVKHYLPDALLPRIEAELLTRPAYHSPIATISDIRQNGLLEAWSVTAFSCIRNFADYLDSPIYFVISHAPIPSAMICKFDDFQCIVITACLSENMTRLAANLLAEGNIFEFLLKSVEPSEPTGIAQKARKEAVYNCARQNMAISTEIWNVAHLLTNYSSYFIIAHEISHILLGHFDSHNAMSMVEFEVHDVPPTLLSRSNEWQADSFAAIATLFRLNALLEMEAEPNADWLQDPNARVRLIAVLGYLIFTSMDFLDNNDGDYSLRTHPSPMSRAGLMMATLSISAHHLLGVDTSCTHKICQSAFKAVEVALLNIAGGALSEDEVLKYGNEAQTSLDHFFIYLQFDKANRDYSRLSNISWKYLIPGVA